MLEGRMWQVYLCGSAPIKRQPTLSPSTKRQNELYSEVWKLISPSSFDVPALLPCCQGKLGELTKTAYKTFCTVQFVAWYVLEMKIRAV